MTAHAASSQLSSCKPIAGGTRMRYLILGGGSVTTEFYLPALALMGRLGDATVVDLDAPAIKSSHQQFAAVDLRAQDYMSFLMELAPPSKDLADCVIVALPNQLHVEAVRRALEMERHVLCEKPLALQVQECLQLRALADKKQRLLKVAMSRRYLPSMMLARDIVEARELGEVHSIEVHDCMQFDWRPRSFAFFSPKAGGI
jgi:predicted dehydrogenase